MRFTSEADVLALCEHPGEHELRRRALLLDRDLLETLDDLHVSVERIALEARMREAAVAFGKIRLALDRAGEHAAAERRVGNERAAELARRGERLLGLDAIEERILVLHRRDRVDLVRAADRLRARFRQAERAHLAGFHQALHRADRILDRHVRIDAVLVIEVDDVDAEALQARIARAQHIVGGAVDALLATTTPLRRPFNALPSSSSLCPQPYMSEESRKLIPLSSA
jgi:hypothetical protein